MKIVNRKQFLEMPKGTVYAKITGKWIVGDLCVKHENCGDNDWFYQSFNWVDSHDFEQAVERLEEMFESGASYPVENSISRDGLFDQEDMFLIYEDKDVNYIVEAITNQSKEG